MSERNKAIVRRSYEEVLSRGQLEVVDELVSEDFVAHTPSHDIRGAAKMRQYVRELRGAFPDLQITVEDQIAEGDKVVSRWSATGTHAGPYQGIPATGKRGRMSGVDIDYVVDGKVVECWTLADNLSLLQQLGVLPMPEPATR
jgi:steroid delta-isomerase-like uncharacterized protein